MGVPRLNSSCSPNSVLRRWHVTTQELLIRHLRALWADDRPRVMVDLGAHAGHGLGRNISDALLWLDHFHAPGSIVLGVDAFEDYALDLEHRFHDVPPYSAMRGVEKRSVHAALGTPNARWHTPCPQASTTAGMSGGGGGGGSDSASMCIDLGMMAAYTFASCTRTDWFDDYERMDRHADAADHVCRITRQRAGVSSSRLALPPSAFRYNVSTRIEPGKGRASFAPYLVPLIRADELIRRHVPASRRIDFLKVDYDTPWSGDKGAAAAGLGALVSARAFAVMSLEIDHRYDSPPSRVIEEIVSLAQAHEYAVMLKVPCAGGGGAWIDRPMPGSRFNPLGQRAAYLPLSGRYHALVERRWGVGLSAASKCDVGGEHCAIQDLMLVDLQMAELRHLIALGNAECGTRFPHDVTEAWDDHASPAAAAPWTMPPRFRSPPQMSLVGERENRRPAMWQDPRPTVPRLAKRLPDGTYSCRLRKAELNSSAANAVSAEAGSSSVPPAPPLCQL